MGELMSRRRSEEALRAAKLESDLASRAKSEFLANMSHELRTPLNAIIGFSEFIQHMQDTAAQQDRVVEYATHISGAGRHLLNIIGDILDISKIESGNFKLDLGRHDPAEIVESCVSMVRPRIGEKSQALEVKVTPDLPPLMLDERRVKQILINLLSNAHKFTPVGGRIVLVVASNRNNSVSFAVADSGIGMNETQVARAMTPFGQVESAFSRSQEGTGLGLPIAAALTRLHGGEFHISSEPGQGTTVVFTLPATNKAASQGEKGGEA
ncbi:ATP-binding protein [Parvibaculum sp.]|uniref:sensor histidine kinase n=1 Tax=Parvibaculum sp. TaxID=2024848 RepID=UPI0025FD50CB|nr:ATP-binding protein [Parvibaculum sp.]